MQYTPTLNFTAVLPNLHTDCTDGELRLVGGTFNGTGRLEVCFQSHWGTVCDDLFNDTAAGVACRQLGYEAGSTSVLIYCVDCGGWHIYFTPGWHGLCDY